MTSNSQPDDFEVDGRRIHLVGMNGVGMSALAQLLIGRGCQVSGSDKSDGPRLDALRKLGARIAIGHDASHVQNVDLVVASPAIPRRNVELQSARNVNIPVISRTQALVRLVGTHSLISVAGSHGKTTSTAMLTLILDRAGHDPSFMIGGSAIQSKNGETGGYWGSGRFFVSETCEAFRALDDWKPQHCIITNIDDEHTNHYGSIQNLKAAFSDLISRTDANGIIAVGGDDPGIQSLLPACKRKVIRFGLNAGNDIRAEILKTGVGGSSFRVIRDRHDCGVATLAVPGAHNVRNALGAIAMALELGVPYPVAVEALAEFKGVAGRWQNLGTVRGVGIFADMAHHPAEIDAVLSVARCVAGANGKVLAVVEPQLHSRVAKLAGRFAAALSAADQLLLLPVDAMGEPSDLGASDAALSLELDQTGTSVIRLSDASLVADTVARLAATGDVVVLIGLRRTTGVTASAIRRALRPRGEPIAPRSDFVGLSVSVGPISQGNSRTAGVQLLHHFFERQADRAPDSICIEDEDDHWTYGQLEHRANQVAHFLIRQGVGPDSLVVLHLKKTPRAVAIMLGVLKAGGAYLPLDPSDYKSIRATVAELAVHVVVSNSALQENWGNEHVFDPEAFWVAIELEDGSRAACPAGASDLAYVVFTSGSTGRPKPVGVEHRSIVNLVDYAIHDLFDADDLRNVAFNALIDADSCVHQIFTALAHGGRLILKRDIFAFLGSETANRITALGAAPSVLASALEVLKLPQSLRLIMLGGELIPEPLLDRIRALGTSVKILNLYGPTEATIYSSVAWIQTGVASEPPAMQVGPIGRRIGKPIRNTRFYIVDDSDRLVPIGEAGEIRIAGAGVARGYLGMAELTAERFDLDPYGESLGGRWYRTGDRGRMRADGSIEFIGRIDGQLKLHGIRLESEEIEANIVNCPGVRQAAVVLCEDSNGARQLIAFFVGSRDVELQELRRFLRDRVPTVMLPAALIRLGRLPVTRQGKVDRAMLATLQVPEATTGTHRAVARRDTTGIQFLHQYFERQADRIPDAVCLEDGDDQWTYGELEQRANQVARFLIRHGVGPDSLVVLHLEKTPRLVAMILGILKAGGAYVPLDPRMDRGPLHGSVGHLGARVVVTEAVTPPGIWSSELVLDPPSLWSAIEREDPSRPACPAEEHHLAYAISTSGSTGRPKLVGVEHRNVVNLIDYAIHDLLDAEYLRCVGFIDSIGADACVHQIFTTLAHGGRLVFARDLFSLLRAPAASRITSLGAGPSVLASVMDVLDLPGAVRIIQLGGEVIPESLINRIWAQKPTVRILNCYGPTEATVYATVAWIKNSDRTAPSGSPLHDAGRIIGKPIQNTRIYLLDMRGLPVPSGEVGEIYISGAGVIRGYLGSPELTAERFGLDPYAEVPGTRWYRTGDHGRLRADGSIEFIGRIDGQFKLHGVRLEAEEIEAHIAKCPGIQRATIILQTTANNHKRLVAFFVGAPDIDLPKLRTFLQGKIPLVMIPAVLVRLERLPLTPAGKVDRALLATMSIPGHAEPVNVASPGNDAERRLLEIWKQALGKSVISIDDNFFDLGGDSLKSMEMMLAVEMAFSVRLEVDTIEQFGTIIEFARHIDRLKLKQEQKQSLSRVRADADDHPETVQSVGASSEMAPNDRLREILRKQQIYVTTWKGHRHKPGSFIVAHNEAGHREPLFWCFQGYEELQLLSLNLDSDQPVLGMRSGHLVMSYSDENVSALAEYYAREMIELRPSGPFQLAGNCQGGFIARAIAFKLREAGREVSKLILMEQSKFPPYDRPVALLFGRDSPINPYGRIPDPEAIFNEAYAGGFTMDLIDGTHGEFFTAENIPSLARTVSKILSPTMAA